MLLVLIAVAVATILSLSFLSSQATSHGVAQNVQKHAQARSVAESALVVAINYVQTNADWRTDKFDGQWVTGASFNGGTFDLFGYDGLDTDGDGVVDDTDGDLADDSSDPVTITVVGYFDGVSHTVHAVVGSGGGSGLDVLFVVGDDTGLTTQDQDKSDLMTGWGMGVTLIDDGASQAEFDAAMASVDVVYVAASAAGATVGTKLTPASIGVVSDQDDLNDDLAISDSAGGSYTGSSIDITDNTHFITSMIASADMDDLSITTGNQELSQANGTLGAGATTLATLNSGATVTLMAVEAGALLEDGSTADGRRVLLPWGTVNIDITTLNTAGQTILKRSLIWGGQSVPVWTAYDFANRTQGTDIWAYDGESNSLPTDNTTPASVLSGAEYNDIESDDALSHNVSIGKNGRYTMLRYVIQIDEAQADVISLRATWIGRNVNGHPPRADGASLFIWNYASGVYEQLAVSADTEIQVTLQGSVSTNVADYIGGASADTVTLLASSRDKGTGGNPNTLYNDYVALSVGAAPASSSTDPALIAQYEFTEIWAEPSLVGHWTLDDVTDELAVTYDYANRTPGSDVFAYEGQAAGSVPSNSTTPSNGFSAGDYTEIEADDAASHSYQVSQNARYGQMRYALVADADETNPFRIEVTWIGRNDNQKASATDGVGLYIWNDTTAAYELLELSADTDTQVTLSGSITSSPADYLGGAGSDTLTLLAETRGQRQSNKVNALYNDYLWVKLNGGLRAIDNQSGNDGTASDGVTPAVTGHGDGGTALQFDGADDYVEVPHTGAYLLNNGAVSFWFKSDDLTGHRGLVSKDSAGFDTGGHLHIYTDGTVLKAQLQSTTSTYEVTSSGLATGSWYHVVVSFGPCGLKLFRDGSQADWDAYTGGLGTNSGGAGNYEPIVLGANTWNSGDLTATALQDYFNGAIDDLRIYDQGLNATQANNVYNGNAPGVGDATVAYDTGGYAVPLNLSVRDLAKTAWQPGGGLTINSATRIVSQSVATKLYDALAATNQMSLEVVFTPTNVTQSGPVRIVNYSGGTADRNFTFGQETDAYIARLNTTTTTSNGTPNADSGSALTAGTQEHAIVSYDGANITMYRDGGSTTTLARTGDLDWDNSFNLMLGNEAVDGYGWLGTLNRVAIYDKAFNQNQAVNVFDGLPPGDGSGTGGVDWIEP